MLIVQIIYILFYCVDLNYIYYLNYFSPAYFDILVKFWFKKFFSLSIYDEKSLEINSIKFTHSSFFVSIAIGIGIGICCYIQEKTGFPFFDRFLESISDDVGVKQTNEFSNNVFNESKDINNSDLTVIVDVNDMVKVVNTEVSQKDLVSISSISNEISDNINNEYVIEETIIDDNWRQRQLFFKCETVEEFELYSMFVNDKQTTWSDIIILHDKLLEHDIVIKDFINKLILLEYNDNNFIDKLSLYLNKLGYYELNNSIAIKRYMQHFNNDIISFRKNRHFFTDNDIKLELNNFNKFNWIYCLYEERKTTSKTAFNKIISTMQKMGYSNNYILFKKMYIIKKLAEIAEKNK